MLPLILYLLFASDSSSSWWSVKTSDVDSNLRGVSFVLHNAVSEDATVWASGSNGVILRSTDTGKSWTRMHIPKANSLDFRGVKAFDDNVAYVMASGEGEKSAIYKTSDGGQTWALQYSDARQSFFLDALVCSDKTHCFALSDPIDGKFLLLATEDGRHWRELPRDKMPAALPNEGCFAASNSAVLLDGDELYFGTGGPAARVFHSPDRGQTWSVTETPILSGKASAGIFSLANDGKTIVAVGGDYQNPKLAQRNAALSTDGGKTWRLADTPPAGYRSAVANCSTGFVAVGLNGSEFASDNSHWRSIDERPFNAVAASLGEAWAVGPNGTVARFLNHTKLLL